MKEESELTYEEHCKKNYDISVVIDSLSSITMAGVVSEDVRQLIENNIIVLEKVIKDKS